MRNELIRTEGLWVAVQCVTETLAGWPQNSQISQASNIIASVAKEHFF